MTAAIGRESALTDALSTAFFVMHDAAVRKFVSRHAGVTGLMFRADDTRRKVEQTLVQAAEFTIPAGSLLHWEEPEESWALLSMGE